MSGLPDPKNGYYFTLDELDHVAEHVNETIAAFPGGHEGYRRYRRALFRLMRLDVEGRRRSTPRRAFAAAPPPPRAGGAVEDTDAWPAPTVSEGPIGGYEA